MSREQWEAVLPGFKKIKEIKIVEQSNISIGEWLIIAKSDTYNSFRIEKSFNTYEEAKQELKKLKDSSLYKVLDKGDSIYIPDMGLEYVIVKSEDVISKELLKK